MAFLPIDDQLHADPRVQSVLRTYGVIRYSMYVVSTLQRVACAVFVIVRCMNKRSTSGLARMSASEPIMAAG